jgi:hypothetical protein
MTKSKKATPKKPTRATGTRRVAPSRKKAREGGHASPEPDPAPTGEPGPPPGKGKVTGITLGLGDDGKSNEATVTQTDPIPDSAPPKPLTNGKKLAPGLYWNEKGQINCEQHVPYPGSDTWVFEHWKKIDRASAKEAAEKGMELSCETCKAIAGRANAPATPRKKKEPAPKAKTMALDPNLTLGHLVGVYLDHLQQTGKSLATQFSYSMDLVVAKRVLGNDTLIADLTPERVAEYYASPEVTMRKNGKPKTKVTVDKCRRVLRLALVWAAEMGLIAEAPLPTTTEKA